MEALPEPEAGLRETALAWADRHGGDVKAAIQDAESVHCLFAYLTLLGLDERLTLELALSIVDDAWELHPAHLKELCQGILMSADMAASGTESDLDSQLLKTIDSASEDAFRASMRITETLEAQAGSPPTTTAELREFLLGLSRLSASAAMVESVGYLGKLVVLTVGSRGVGRVHEARAARAAAGAQCTRGITRAHAISEAGVASEPDPRAFILRACNRVHRLLLERVPVQTILDLACS